MLTVLIPKVVPHLKTLDKEQFNVGTIQVQIKIGIILFRKHYFERATAHEQKKK